MNVARHRDITKIIVSLFLKLLVPLVGLLNLPGLDLLLGKKRPILDLYSLSEQHILQYNVTYFIYSDVGLVVPPGG